ncbi:MAG TPA: sugar kinase [Flavisolibacter sp.]|nr:sugar kinase [Flavisolibacter sp.]
MNRIFCFGELLLRLSPELGGQWLRQNAMPVFIGGAELNVATALARWNTSVAYGTALPGNYLSSEIIDFLNQRNVDTTGIIVSGNRIGTYYLSQGADLKNADVIYDRAYSSFAGLQPGQINWDEVLKNIDWFHFSAISPALNANVAAVCGEALRAASKKGAVISIDLNYRAKLWQYGKHPQEVMPELVEHCDVVMGNLWAIEKMLGLPVATDPMKNKDAYVEHSLKTSESLGLQFPKCKQVANTFRFDVNNGVNYYATLYAQNKIHCTHEHKTDHVIDKVGSGDAFMAGLIYGNICKWNPQESIEFAAASAFAKLFIRGDATTASVEEIKKLI